MNVLHISVECYPAAKVGGLADVVGALPKYLTKAGMETGVIIPRYSLPWINQRKFTTVHHGEVRLHHDNIPFAIQQLDSNELGFPLFVVAIPGKFDRPGVYADPSGNYYQDEAERYLCFQMAVLKWVASFAKKPDVLHCHDHHTGLTPFMVKHSFEFESLQNIPTVFTIHNGEYHGAFSWNGKHLLPYFKVEDIGLLDWNHTINPLATGIKTCWHLTTVSPSYLEELNQKSNGLENLFRQENPKSTGIINGIDSEVWDPKTDPYLVQQLKKSVPNFKKKNKKALTDHFGLNPDLPLITFIGRLVREKGADLIPDLISQFLYSGQQASFIVLGTGDPYLMDVLGRMGEHFKGFFHAQLEYNEGLAHQLYAGSDFLLMPSRVEPCGLNQMYAMRYGTVPIVRSVGGLRDTVSDVGEEDGRGIRFDHFTLDDAGLALYRATEVYKSKKYFSELQKRIMSLDFSWERSAESYINIYNSLTKK
ncbi:MAG: glycogen synthase [Bacteroidota bacterium]